MQHRYTEGRSLASDIFTASESLAHYQALSRFVSENSKSLACTALKEVSDEERSSAQTEEGLFGRYNFGYVRYPRSEPVGYQL